MTAAWLAISVSCLLADGPLSITPIDTAGPAFPTATDYLRILERFPRYAERGFHTPYREDASLGWFGDGRSDENGQRTMGNFILAYAYLATAEGYDSAVGGVPRETVEQHALAALRYMLRTHVTGDLPCTDGRPWGDHWQSAWWTSKMVGGATLLEAKLTDAERAAIETLVTHEADRHIGLPPRVNQYGDTKSEENAWDCEVLAWAINRYPNHPHRPGWEDALTTLSLNTLSVAADLDDVRRVRGKPLNQWLGSSPCIHPDFTIENHGFFHICYMVCPLHSFAWCYYAYRLHGTEPPATIYHHTREVWERTKWFALWEDRFAYAGGKDWPRYAYGMYFILPALVQYQQVWADGDARRIEQRRVARFEQEQRQWADGSFFSGRWTALRMERWPAEWETDAAANLTIAALLHRLGPTPEPTPAEAFHQAREGTFISPYSELAARRDPQRWASWCWKANGGPISGLVCSDAGEHQLEWNHTLGGSIRLEGAQPATVVAAHAEEEFPGGFTTVGSVHHGTVSAGPSPWRLAVRDTNVPCATIVEPAHPLFAGPSKVESIAGLADLDSLTEAGPGWTPLARNRDGGPSFCEARLGDGRLILSMTNVEEKLVAGDATARAIWDNLVAWWRPATRRCLYVRGEAHLRAALDLLQIPYDTADNLARAQFDAYDVIFIDRTCTAIRAHYPRLLRFVEQGGLVFHSVIQDERWTPDLIARAAPVGVIQDVAFSALPDGRTCVLFGRWRAGANIGVAALDVLDWRLANDIFNGERRDIWYGSGQTPGGLETLVGPKLTAPRTVDLPGDWLNVDGDLGLVASRGLRLGLTDDPARRAPHGSLRYATIHARPTLAPGYAAGEPICWFTLVFRTRQTPGETAALAAQLAERRPESNSRELAVRVPGADGRDYTVTAQFGDRPTSRLSVEDSNHGRGLEAAVGGSMDHGRQG